MISRISCRYLSKKSIQAAEAIEATLTLFKLSDVSYIAVIQSESFNSQIDLEDLSFDDKTGTCLFNSATNDGCSDDENNQCILSFNSQDDYQFAKDIYDECVHICNNVLSLNSMIRDFYVSGIRNSIGSKRNLLLSHEILKQFSTSSISEDFLFSDSQPQHNSLKAKGKVFDVRSNAKCFYCSVTSAMDCVRKFVVHPYVPQSSKSVPVVMCLICLENWKEYRDKAEFENELILADQVNEEICALCSDTPPELILCDVCPRSYCHNCLEKIVGPEAINDIVGPSVKSAWKCFPCRVGYIKTPPLSKSYWVYMDGPSSSSSSGKSTGVRGKMNSASTKDPDKDEDLTLVFEKAPKPKRNIVAEGEYLVKAQLSTDDYQTRGSSMKRDRISKNKLLADGDHVVPPVASTTEVTPDVRPMPCTTQSEAELFYFSQYVKYFDNLDADCSNHPSKKRETDDACYLCKDGGDLIVCDWKRNRGNLRCLKCYHETCLSYSIPDNQVWICMRHFCMSCGEKKLKYMCKFCSNSICADCPEKVVEKYGLSRHLEVTTPNTREFPESVQVIVCQTCLDLINLCISKESLPSDYRYSAKNILRFPGKFDSKHATSTYLVAPVSASTQHISNTNENKELSTNETDKLSSQTVEVDKTVDSHSLVDIACSISQTTSPEVEKISATTTVVELTGAAAPIETEGVKRRAFFRVSSAISPKRHRSDESDKKETECRVVAQGTDSKNSHVEPESSMSIADLQAFRDFLATK